MSTDDWLAAGLVLVLIPGVFLTVYELVMSWDPTTRWRTEDRQPGESSWTWRTVVLIAFWSLVVPAVLTAWVLFLVN
jgi:TRAP-type mannitol/chloroaromatic compound transport system permease small subunit